MTKMGKKQYCSRCEKIEEVKEELKEDAGIMEQTITCSHCGKVLQSAKWIKEK